MSLTQCDEPEQEAQQEQQEEEEAQQPLPPRATGVRAAAKSSTSEDAAVSVDLCRQMKESNLYFLTLRCSSSCKYQHTGSQTHLHRWLCLSLQLQMSHLLREQCYL